MKKIGIIPKSDPFTSADLYEDKYQFAETYNRRVVEAGAVPVGILPVDRHVIPQLLDECDAFVINGGSLVTQYHLETVEHALRTGKKLLGICMGCQTLYIYFEVLKEAEKTGYTGSLAELFIKMRKEGHRFLEKHPGHHPSEFMPRENTESVKHRVTALPDSLFASIVGRTEVMGASMHFSRIPGENPMLRITGRADDGTVEIVEYKKQMIGVQFHPDVDNDMEELFRWLVL